MRAKVERLDLKALLHARAQASALWSTRSTSAARLRLGLRAYPNNPAV